MSAPNRPARVASEFQHEISQLIARGLKDPRVTGFVTVTGGKMSPDLKEATVYVSIHGDDAVREKTFEGLQAAAGYLQRETAKRLGLRYTPHLRFVYDESVARGDRIERLLREAKAHDDEAKAQGGEAKAQDGGPRGEGE
jgi:ribosome-binding factor A